MYQNYPSYGTYGGGNVLRGNGGVNYGDYWELPKPSAQPAPTYDMTPAGTANDPTLMPGATGGSTTPPPATTPQVPSYNQAPSFNQPFGMNDRRRQQRYPYATQPRETYVPPDGAIQAGIQWSGGRIPNAMYQKGWRSKLGPDGKWYWYPPGTLQDSTSNTVLR